jgi:hypothetical protein
VIRNHVSFSGARRSSWPAPIRAQGKGKISSMTLDSDHSFADHPIALAAAVVGWLQHQAAPGAASKK